MLLLKVRQKKYEVLDNKHSLNGVVTITTVTNLHANNEFNQNQVKVESHLNLSRSIKHIGTKTFQNGDISYNNVGGGGGGAQIHKRATPKKVNSELMALCNLPCNYAEEDLVPEEDKSVTDNEDVSLGYS